MAAYYNEIDPFAAAWLRELIARDDAETLTQFYTAVIGHLDGHPVLEAA